jgi:hypothetical protein
MVPKVVFMRLNMYLKHCWVSLLEWAHFDTAMLRCAQRVKEVFDEVSCERKSRGN